MQQPARHMTPVGAFADQPWADRALCAQTDPEAFFPEKGGSTREAKQVCNGNPEKGLAPCPVRAECLDWALEHEERFGIFGGTSERERRKLKKEQTALAATGTDGPAYDVDDETPEKPAPVHYGGTYIGGGNHRPVPLATDIAVRPAHQPKTPRPTGLDWSKHTAPETTTTQQPVTIAWPCRGCGQKSSDLENDLCPSCRDAADTKFHVPTTVPDLEAVQTQPVAPIPDVSLPGYVDDIVAVMLATEGHPDPTVRAARKVVANALVDLHKTLAQVFPHTPAATDTPAVAAGPTRSRKPRKTPAARRGPRGNPQTEAAIVRLYTGPEDLSCPQIAERLDIGVKAVRAALDRAGIERTDGRTTHSGGNNRVTAYPDELVVAIRTRYLDHQMTQAEVAADLDITVKVVQSVMAKHKIPARPAVPRNPRSVLTDPADLDELCARYQAGESGSALAKAYGVSLPTILDRLRGRNIPIRNRGGRRTNTEENQPA